MSTGKRLAKRSILGTRVACCLEDGKYYPGIICDVKNTEEGGPSVYSVRIEGDRKPKELKEGDLVGSGFTPVSSVKLRADQKVFITFNNREVSGTVIYHRPNIDEVLISVTNPENNVRQEVKKRLEEVRLLESRKSARLADQDTDFAKLADCTSERNSRKTSSTIDVPGCFTNGSRKRRGSRAEDDLTDECAAALVLMKLSCSPRSPVFPEGILSGECFSGASSASSGVWSWVGHPQLSSSSSSSSSSRSPLGAGARSASPSPSLSDSSPPPPPPATDDGIDLDDPFYADDIIPRKRRSSTRVMFKCTWQDCPQLATSCPAIEQHIRTEHLGLGLSTSGSSSDDDLDDDDEDTHEEEFYWREVEVNVPTWVDPPATITAPFVPSTPPSPPLSAMNACTRPPLPPAKRTSALPPQPPLPQSVGQPQFLAPSKGGSPTSPLSLLSSPPTLSHMDMARPPHEDPDYRRQYTPSVLSSSWPRNASYLANPPSHHKATTGKVRAVGTGKGTSGRGKRSGESRKCRKVYGMEQKDQWCTQCKWKKACSRFGE